MYSARTIVMVAVLGLYAMRCVGTFCASSSLNTSMPLECSVVNTLLKEKAPNGLILGQPFTSPFGSLAPFA